MAGAASYPSFETWRQTTAEGEVALEFRGNTGGVRVRIIGAYASVGKMGEVSFKYDFFDGFFFRPFLALGLGAASINPDPSWRGMGSASAGVDMYLSANVFITAEVKERLFTAGTQGTAHGLSVSDQRMTSFVGGMGFYF